MGALHMVTGQNHLNKHFNWKITFFIGTFKHIRTYWDCCGKTACGNLHVTFNKKLSQVQSCKGASQNANLGPATNPHTKVKKYGSKVLGIGHSPPFIENADI